MAEYIERDAAINAVRHAWAKDLEPTQYIEDIPAADVVPVVRCRDCKYFTEGMSIGMCKRDSLKPIMPMPYDNYCGFGERKDGADVQNT